MKSKIVLIASMSFALISFGQTNPIVFSQLISSTNSVLMTNAEFRCCFGNKIVFKNNAGYQSFHVTDLNVSVLSTLHTSAEKLESQQRELDAKNQQYKEYVAALAIEKARQKQEAIQQAEKVQAEKMAQEKQREQNIKTLIISPRFNVTDRESVGVGAPQ